MMSPHLCGVGDLRVLRITYTQVTLTSLCRVYCCTDLRVLRVTHTQVTLLVYYHTMIVVYCCTDLEKASRELDKSTARNAKSLSNAIMVVT